MNYWPLTLVVFMTGLLWPLAWPIASRRAIVRRSNNARGLKTKYLKIFLWEGKCILFGDQEWKDFSQESYGFSVSKFLSVLPWTSFLGPGSTAANNGYMSVPTNSYNNNSQNGSDVRLISSTPSMTDSRQGSTFWIDRYFSKWTDFFEIENRFSKIDYLTKKTTFWLSIDFFIL